MISSNPKYLWMHFILTLFYASHLFDFSLIITNEYIPPRLSKTAKQTVVKPAIVCLEPLIFQSSLAMFSIPDVTVMIKTRIPETV